MRYLLSAYLAVASMVFADEPSQTATSQPTPEQLEFFEKSIRPILVERCHKCHGPQKQEAELRLDSRAGILKGGESGPIIDLQEAAKNYRYFLAFGSVDYPRESAAARMKLLRYSPGARTQSPGGNPGN